MTLLWVVLLVAGWALVPLPLAVVLGRVFAQADAGRPVDGPVASEPPVRRTTVTPLQVLPAPRSSAASLG